MKKFHLLLSIVSSILFTIFISSCDTEYDLTKEIDPTVTIGKNLSIPIGNTEKIYLSRIITEGDNLTTDATTGIYQLYANGEFSSEIDQIEQFEIEGLAPHFIEYLIDIPLKEIPGYNESMWEYRKDLNLPILKEPFNLEIDVYSEAEYDFEITKTKLPSEVEEIYNITFNGDGKLNANGHTGARSIIKIFIPKEYVGNDIESFNGTHGIKEVRLEEVHIKFPDIFILKDENQEADLPHEIYRHDIVLKEDADDSKNFIAEIEVYIEGVEMPEELKDKYFITENGDKYFQLSEEDKITLTVDKAYLSAIPAKLEGKQVLFDFTYEIDATNITSVNGKIKQEINLDEDLALNDLPDFIKDESSVFKPNDLTFKFTLDNPFGLELASSFNIIPYNNDGTITSTPITIDIKDEHAIKPESINKFVISNKDREVAADETLFILESLPGLISPIPDYYKITLGEVTADGKNSSGLELGKTYSISGTYDIEVPFSFEDISIQYTDKITGLQESLEGISESLSNIVLEADFESNIPVGLELKFKFYDSEDNELTEIESQDIIIDAAGNDGQAKVSKIKLKLSADTNSQNELERLEKIVYTVKAANKVKNVYLSSKQYLQLKNIVVKIPNGITVES